MKPPPFEYVAVESLDEALGVLAKHGDEAKVLAGGQSLVPLLAFRLARPSVLVDLNRVPGLDYLRLDGGTVAIGALARHRDVEALAGLGSRCPLIAEAVEQVGHVAIRNRGTVCGSVAHADPAAEWPGVALALDGECELAGPGGTRTVPAREFLRSYFTTALEPDEILTEVRLELPDGASGSCFVELTRRHGDFALAGVGALVRIDGDDRIVDARIALIGVGETAVRARASETLLVGERPAGELLDEAARAVDGEISPTSDLHGSAGYRRHVAKVLTRRALGNALERAREGRERG